MVDLWEFSLNVVFSCTDGIISQFLPIAVPELSKFFLLFGDFAPNVASKLEARSKPPPRPPDMEVPSLGCKYVFDALAKESILLCKNGL